MKKLEGTYKMEWRKLPDGRKVRPPEVDGLLTFTKGYRNFNVMWKEKEGNIVSISSVAKYDLSEDRYKETNIYYLVTGATPDEKPEYDLSKKSGSARVKSGRGRIEFRLPLHDEPDAVFEGDELIATRDGEFEDHWKKVA